MTPGDRARLVVDTVDGVVLDHESLVNLPNWALLEFRTNAASAGERVHRLRSVPFKVTGRRGVARYAAR